MNDEPTIRPFVCRSYTKLELAQLYARTLAPRTAMKKFNEWLRNDPKLWQRLQRSGITINTKTYRRSQVRMIVDHLGEP
jgi:hypothetical protein